jgi:hypothetical protein
MTDTRNIQNPNETPPKKEDLSRLEKWINGIAIGFAITGILVLIIAVALFKHGENIDYSLTIKSNKFSEFGSFISGSVGVIWSFVSVLLFYLALRLQRKDLNMQRIELEGQRKQMEKQNETLSLQQFENTFFQLLNVHNSMVQSIDFLEYTQIHYEGIYYFKHVYSRVDTYTDEDMQKYGNKEVRNDLVERYQKTYEQYKHLLSRYFTNLYQILNFIDKATISDKYTYSSILRAQLSLGELGLIFCHFVIWDPMSKTKQLIEKYTIFKYMDKNTPIYKLLSLQYKQGAFDEHLRENP